MSTPSRDSRIKKSTYISANMVIVEMDGVPLGMLRNLSLSEQVDEEEITEIGNSLVEDHAVGLIRANLSGTFIVNDKMGELAAGFFPSDPIQFIANRLVGSDGFTIAVYPRKALIKADGTVSFEKMPAPLFSVKKCRYTGSNIDISANKPLTNSFQAKAQMIEKNFQSFQQAIKESVAA